MASAVDRRLTTNDVELNEFDLLSDRYDAPSISPPIVLRSMSDEEEQLWDPTERLKVKFLSAWNNVRNGWTFRSKVSFPQNETLWLLGRCYLSQSPSASTSYKLLKTNSDGIEDFYKDFCSRIWFTYRKEFPTLADSSYTSDCGWGCMLRTGQMIMAQGLLMHLLDRSWTYFPQNGMHDAVQYTILRWFDDSPAHTSPFGLPSLISYGKQMGKRVGDWYGPSCIAFTLREALTHATKNSLPELQLLNQLSIYVAQDCTVYKEDVLKLFHHSKSVIIFVPIRLGCDTFNPLYTQGVQKLFTFSSCLGIIGGRPKHSLYFVGYQGDKFIYLDPHFCQSKVDMNPDVFDVSSFHCPYPRKMAINKMDPNCTVGFYCRTINDFFSLCNDVSNTTPRGVYPMFVISDSSIEKSIYRASSKDTILRVHHVDTTGKALALPEEYVFL